MRPATYLIPTYLSSHRLDPLTYVMGDIKKEIMLVLQVAILLNNSFILIFRGFCPLHDMAGTIVTKLHMHATKDGEDEIVCSPTKTFLA